MAGSAFSEKNRFFLLFSENNPYAPPIFLVVLIVAVSDKLLSLVPYRRFDADSTCQNSELTPRSYTRAKKL